MRLNCITKTPFPSAKMLFLFEKLISHGFAILSWTKNITVTNSTKVFKELVRNRVKLFVNWKRVKVMNILVGELVFLTQNCYEYTVQLFYLWLYTWIAFTWSCSVRLWGSFGGKERKFQLHCSWRGRIEDGNLVNHFEYQLYLFPTRIVWFVFSCNKCFFL